jgi:hypothetical protein
LRGRIAGRWSTSLATNAKDVLLTPKGDQKLRLDLMVVTPRDLLLRRLEAQTESGLASNRRISIPQTQVFSKDELDTATHAKREIAELAGIEFSEVQRRSEERWRDHWSRSAVAFADKELERIWYHNQYFLACCLRKNRTAPGLFANWSSGDIGTAWHSDYHLDYNCQQVYWGVFSSNHVDMHQPYVELCENLMPMSEKFAHDSYGLPGAFFPLSAFPVPSQIVPYPVPPWGYQICMTPWAVQSLWWEYLYTQDDEYLRYVYPMMKAAALFVTAYLKKDQDQRYNIVPSISSENWGFTVDYRLNKNCILDLSLISFLLDAVVKASTVLNVDHDDRVRWSDIRNNLAKYPTGKGPYGEVWLDVEAAPVEHIYNVPITLAPVFPGEQVGIGKGREHWEIAIRTAKTIRLEGGNDLVSQPLIRARLKILDLDWFKEQVQYCKLPNEMSNDRVRQIGGRYSQSTDFDFMMRMGIWCENFALPAVLNECMLQGYTGVIRLFPNTQNLGPARFENLRAVGAYLVSASHDGKSVTRVTIHSEKARQIRIESPWPGKAIRATRSDGTAVVVDQDGEVFTFSTDADATYSILPD